MNAWQLCKQLQYLLRLETWPGGSNKIFASDSVLLSPIPDDGLIRELRKPLCIVWPLGGENDPVQKENPEFIHRRFRVRIATENFTDALGQSALVGGARASDTASGGRGILEIETQVSEAIGFLSRSDGVVIQMRGQSAAIPVLDGDNGVYIFEDLDFEAFITRSRTYPPAVGVSTSGATVSWTNPGTRFDSYRMVVRRASGATAPATITDGTNVTLAGNFSTSFTEADSGTWSYSIFATYDDLRGTPDSDDSVSAALTKTSLVVP